MIPFNSPPVVGTEMHHVQAAIGSGALSGSGDHTRRCEEWLDRELGCHRALLTPSCTDALEMAALLLDVGPGDEVIMPSYTFASTANAFVLRGARIVFVDVAPDTMNLDARLVEAAVTRRTRGVVPVHYAGVACDMDPITAVADAHGLWVVEDAAQAIGATYRGRALGTIGDVGCLSFHETKSVTAGGEGGAILVNRPELVARAEVLREKGTDRSRFRRGEVDRYTWQDIGSSYLMSDLQAAYLLAQLDAIDRIERRRHALWDGYARALGPLAAAGRFTLPAVPPHAGHNAHMFALKLPDRAARDALIDALRVAGVMATFHYVPLHSSPAGRRFGRFAGTDAATTDGSRRLVRLPLFYNMTDEEHRAVVDAVARHVGRPRGALR